MNETMEQLIPQMMIEWDDMLDYYYPDRQSLYEFIVSIIPRETGMEKVLDLFAGSGGLSRKILYGIPGIKLTLVDSDEPILNIAQYRLKDLKKDVQFKLLDFEKPGWDENLPNDFGLIVTPFAFQLLTERRKPELYKKIYSLLRDQGMFICLDVAGSGFPEYDKMCTKQLERLHYNPNAGRMKEEWADFWNRTGKRFGKENFAEVVFKRIWNNEIVYRGSLSQEFELLREAGFSEVECFYRDLSFVVYGGLKNNGG